MAREMDRKAKESRQRLVAAHEKAASIAKMLDHAAKLETNAMIRAHRHGVPQAEIARVLGVSAGRVWQMLKEAGALDAPGSEPAAEEHAERVSA